MFGSCKHNRSMKKLGTTGIILHVEINKHVC